LFVAGLFTIFSGIAARRRMRKTNRDEAPAP
jgi:hypothetical protein